jgi:SAM-dependent MidA family methyltransferase
VTDVAAAIRSEIDRHGTIPFARFHELALYGPDGFYERGGAGRHRDFLTSPEVGPLFGALMARYLDAVWDDLDCPDPFVVVEPGAGPGTLAVAVLAARPRCAPVLRYVLVDRSARQRARQSEHLGLVPHAEAFAKSATTPDGDPATSCAAGPLVVTLESMPREIDAGVIIANELLDNLPVDLVERTNDGWAEVRVGFVDGAFVETVVPTLGGELGRLAERYVASAGPLGARIPIQRAVSEWLRAALARMQRGRVLAIDYARTTPELADLDPCEWLRTYRGHERGTDPLTEPGACDITCDVATDQLAAVRSPDEMTDQASWLRSNGIDEFVSEGKAEWEQRAATGDLAALRARSRIGEAEALLDPTGLGGFTVLEWWV